MKIYKTVNNVPEYAKAYRFIVARPVDGQLWFWGAYDFYARACEVVKEIDGVIIPNEVEL